MIPFYCPFCRRAFYRSRDCEIHMRLCSKNPRATCTRTRPMARTFYHSRVRR